MANRDWHDKEEDLRQQFEKVKASIGHSFALRKRPLSFEEFNDFESFFSNLEDHWLEMHMQIINRNSGMNDIYTKSAILGELLKEAKSLQRLKNKEVKFLAKQSEF